MDTLFMDVFSMFDTDDTAADFQPITAGHINHTYAVFVVGEQHPKYVLQKINTDVFQKPDELIANIKGVCSHIRRKIIERGGDPMRETLTLLPTKNGQDYYHDPEKGCWRLYYFISNSEAHQSADRPGLLYEAAKAFGNFQYLLSDYPADTLYETIPNFHNTVSRYKDFMRAVENIQNITVAEDSSIDRGGCIIETDFGAIDARISSQLAELEQKILEISPIKTVAKSSGTES